MNRYLHLVVMHDQSHNVLQPRGLYRACTSPQTGITRDRSKALEADTASIRQRQLRTQIRSCLIAGKLRVWFAF